jgi:hypothetical protein
MTLTIPDDVRAKAEIYVGDAAGQEKTRFMLEETGLPSGLLPLRDIVECGYVEETGFVWLKQRRKVDHFFAKAGRHVSYGAEVSAVAEKGRLKKITGVKAKEMLIWVTLHEICLDGDAEHGGNGKLLCKAFGGLSRSFPVEAFEAPGQAAARGSSKPAVGEVASRDDVAAAAGGDEKLQDQEQAEAEKPAEVEEEGKAKEDASVGKIEEKLQEMSTTAEGVHAEAVAAKN